MSRRAIQADEQLATTTANDSSTGAAAIQRQQVSREAGKRGAHRPVGLLVRLYLALAHRRMDYTR